MIIAANWKMNPQPSEVSSLFAGYCGDERITQAKTKVLSFVPSCYLTLAKQAFEASSIQWGAQNCHPELSGAYTGEVSAEMIKGLGCRWVLAGHSERRSEFGETDAFVGAKLVSAMTAGLNVVLCIGEPRDQRDRGRQNDYVANQLLASLAGFCDQSSDWQAAHLSQLIIAYEPVWAIGTGLVATSEQIKDMHTFIHERLVQLFSPLKADLAPPILYGGSVKEDNAYDILSLPLVGGALVGGASLSAGSFAAIASSADAVIQQAG